MRLSVLRMLSSELNYKQIALQRELTDADVLDVIQKEAKKRREAIDSYQKANRPEAVAQEEAELQILGTYLPTQLSEAEIKTEIGDLSRYQNFVEAIKVLSLKFKGRADGATVVKIVKEHFA